MKSLRYHMLSTVRTVGIHARDNEIRDTLAKIMQDVCFDVEVEPTLQLIQVESLIHKTTITYEIARL